MLLGTDLVKGVVGGDCVGVSLGTDLVKGVVGGDSDGVGVHHQPLAQQSEEAVRVHDLHLPPEEEIRDKKDKTYTYWQIVTEGDRQAGRQTVRHTNKQTNKQTNKHTHTHTHTA